MMKKMEEEKKEEEENYSCSLSTCPYVIEKSPRAQCTCILTGQLSTKVIWRCCQPELLIAFFNLPVWNISC